ncbi:MAG: hypothetical protein ACI4IF_01225 [Acutalibacteraceae bacterium]
MISFAVMFALSFFQFYILKALLQYVLKGDMLKTLLFLLLKLALYGSVIPLVLFVIKENIIFSASGLISGLIASVTVYAVKEFRSKGDDTVDSDIRN